MNGNDFVKWMLRSPLYPLMGSTMLITVTGRRSGRALTVPVNYYRAGDTLWILSARDRTWWRNIQAGGPVQIRLGGREYAGTAEVILGEKDVARLMADYVRKLPMSVKPLGVRIRDGVVDPADASRLARDRLFIRVCLSEPAP